MRVNEIIFERKQEMLDLVLWLESNASTKNSEDLKKFLNQNYKVEVRTGGFSQVFSGYNKELEYVLKISGDDPAFQQYSKIATRYYGTNPLFPKFEFSGSLVDGTFVYILEAVYVEFEQVKIAKLHAYDLNKLAHLISSNPVSWEEEMIANNEDDELEVLGRVSVGLRNAGSTIGYFEDWCIKCASLLSPRGTAYNADLHGNNMGWRNNGDLVFFDPISPVMS